MELDRLDWILIKAQDAHLTAWEDKFIEDMINRREKYSDDLIVTEAQEDVLERIAEKT